MRYAMIMAGGSGTRLWPMSRESRPKQLIPFMAGRSLLALAASRLDGVVPQDRRYICTNESYRDAIRQSLPEFSDDHILGEPTGRDTLNAVGFTAAVLAAHDPHAVFAVLTADHVIEPQDVFAGRLDVGFKLVEADPSRLVTFGITPTHAATGYGYVERGDAIAGFSDTFRARRFVEKPDRETAEAYLADGAFYWNSGMFVFSAATVLDAIKRYQPASRDALDRIVAEWNGPRRKATVDAIYPTLLKISVDYGLMEPASQDPRLSIAVVPMALRWMDVGSWPTYAATMPADAKGNRAAATWTNMNCRDCLVVSDNPEHVIATVGCENLIIVHTSDATLVCRSDLAEQVKGVASKVPVQYR